MKDMKHNTTFINPTKKQTKKKEQDCFKREIII